MKRAIAVILSVFCMLPSVTAVSASGQISFRAGNIEGAVNRLIEMEMYAQCDKKLSAACFDVYYDSRMLEYRKASVPDNSTIVAKDKGDRVRISYLCTDGAEITNEAVLFTLTFKTIADGSGELGFSVSDCVDADVRQMTVGSCVSGNVHIAASGSGKAESADKAAGSSSPRSGTSSKDDNGKSKTKSARSSSAGGEEDETDPAARNPVIKNEVIHMTYDKATPIIVLSVSVAAGCGFIGYLLFRLRKKRENHTDKSEEK